jgi:predicted nucleic acid-binding protein
MTKNYVLDANPVLDLLQGGRGAQRVRQLLAEALHPGTTLFMSVLNLGEVFYVLWQQQGEQSSRRAIAGLSALPIEFVVVDLVQSFEASELKARHNIPYVDCIAAALALQRQAILVTSDRDFEKLGRHFPVLWIPHS